MKKVIVHFFPSVRFLGLGLKILFHKNKEIERMLSKKMAFSLMSLIAIFALAFVVPTAMAAEFGVTMSIDSDIDVSSEGGTQVYKDWSVAVRVAFAKVVAAGTTAPDFSASDIAVIAYNKFNGVETSPTLTEPANYDGRNPDGMNFTVVVGDVADTAITRVLLYMKKHAVEVADPRADLDAGVRTVDGKSAEASIEIHYVDGDRGRPQVYSIRRVSDPLLPVTAETVQVVIRLSEQPAKFTKDQISVTNATHVDPVALVPQSEDTRGVEDLEERLIEAWKEDNPEPGEAALYTVTPEGEGAVEVPGIHAGLKTNADIMAAYATYNATLGNGTSPLVLTALPEDAATVTSHTPPIHRPFRTTSSSTEKVETPHYCYHSGNRQH